MNKKHLLSFYTRTPLHVGSGSSVDVIDLPIMRERITGFPVIPGTSIKGVLLQHARETFDGGKFAREKNGLPDAAKLLFGAVEEDENKKQKSNAGCIQITEAKLLAFPVRSLSGCFAWITCPAALLRFQRDTGKSFSIPTVEKDKAVAGSELVFATIGGKKQVVLEEYAMDILPDQTVDSVASALQDLVEDPLWKEKVAARLVVVHDDNFQHFVNTCTEVVARIVIKPETRTNSNLFNQENIPCETLFYSVLTTLKPRRAEASDPDPQLGELFPEKQTVILQVGGDETTGHGLCETKRISL